MDRFLEKYNFPKLNEEEAESLNRPITVGEIEAIIKKTTGTQKPWTTRFHRRTLKTFKEKLTPILQRLFQKVQEEGRPSNFFLKLTPS